MCDFNDTLTFRWLSSPDNNQCPTNWLNVTEQRNLQGASQFDSYLKTYLVINVPNPETVYPDLNSVWKAFETKLGTIFSLVSYEPVLRDFFREALEEFHRDNVQHIEIR